MFARATPRASTTPGEGLASVLLRRAESDPEGLCLCKPSETLSNRRVSQVSAHLARQLDREAEEWPTRTLAACCTSAEHVFYLAWACLASGICLAFLPLTRDREHARRLIRQVQASGLVSDVSELLPDSLPIAFGSLLEASRDTAWSVSAERARRVRPDTPAFVFHTSGTTGDVKWVQVSHGQFLTAIECLAEAGGLECERDEVAYIAPPLFHSYGLSSLLEHTYAGNAVMLPSGLSPLGAVGDLCAPGASQRISVMEGVPYFYSQLSTLFERLSLPALRHLGIGGGAIEPAVLDRMLAARPGLSYSLRYGMTETPSVVSRKLYRQPVSGNRSSSGKVLPIYLLRIVDDAGRVLDAGEQGGIQIKGECLALPYYGEDSGPADFFDTGDLGYLDRSGELHVIGRKSAYLKRRGFRISPEYVEAVVNGLNGVLESRVVQRGETLVAELRVSPGVETPPRLIALLLKKLPAYAVPDVITFVDAIEHTDSGKIRRR